MKIRLILPLLLAITAGCASTPSTQDAQGFSEPTQRLTIPEARVQFQLPGSWKVERKRGGIEAEPRDPYPSMRFSSLTGPLGMHHVKGLKNELSDMISSWSTVKDTTVNGMKGLAWEGKGGSGEVNYQIFVLLLDRGENCMLVLMFTPTEVARRSVEIARPVIQSIQPL